MGLQLEHIKDRLESQKSFKGGKHMATNQPTNEPHDHPLGKGGKTLINT